MLQLLMQFSSILTLRKEKVRQTLRLGHHFRHDTRLFQHHHGRIGRVLVPSTRIGTTGVQSSPVHPVTKSRFFYLWTVERCYD